MMKGTAANSTVEGPPTWKLVGCPANLPRQENGYDCGVFVSMYCDCIMRGYEFVLGQEHVDQYRKHMVLCLDGTRSGMFCGN